MEARQHLIWLVVVVVGVVVLVRAYNHDSPSGYGQSNLPPEAELKQLLERIPEQFLDRDEFAVHQLLDKLPERTFDPADPNERPWRIFWLITEVNNGGMDQYFHNSSGDFALETVADLRLIGAPETADLVERGCKFFPEGKPAKDIEVRRQQMNEFKRAELVALDDLSNPFYDRSENLNALLLTWWRKQHPAQPKP